jgi:hypothetical protein
VRDDDSDTESSSEVDERAGSVPVQCGAPTSDPEPELASPPPHSSSLVDLLPPPPIAGRAPPPPAARESEEPGKRPMAGSKRYASQRHAHRRKRSGEIIWREGGSDPRSLFSTVIAGSAGAATLSLHAPFSGSGLVSESFWREP